jgi:hypothetical protein
MTIPPPPKPQESKLAIESSCHCLKPKHLPVRSILLMQNITKNNVRSLGILETVATGSFFAHLSIAGGVPN